MELLAAAGLAGGVGKELFNYNRDNFKFDQDQRIERESLRLSMQVKRFELFREDVRDLVDLTVDRMDVYHLVGALLLQFCVILFCEGRVQASAPPFLLSLFLLSNACAFIFLLLAVWLSMHASIASHSFGVRLLTRFIRLPIPSIKQMNALTMNFKDYEKQGIANLLQMPFLGDSNAWYDGKGGKATEESSRSSSGETELPKVNPASSPNKYTLAVGPEVSPTELATPTTRPTTFGASSASSEPAQTTLPPPQASASNPLGLLAEETEHPLYARAGAGPERHVQLFRQLQSKWQCYDAYCRVSMGLGVNMILQALSYFSICHTLVENRSPSTGYSMTVLFQCTTIALAVLDLAGLKRREIFAIQLVGIMPCFFTAWGVAHGTRTEDGVLDPEQMYKLSPFAFLCQVVWLELWLRVAAPSSDKAKLPRRFRQVLFLDVFGDAVGWDPTVAEGEEEARINETRPSIDVYGTQDDADAEDEEETLKAAGKEASSQLSLAQWAIRRWAACPESILSENQNQKLSQLKQTLGNWGASVKGELDRLREKGGGPAEFPFVFEQELRRLHEMDESERAIDPFAGCLVGPFEHDTGYQFSEFHFNVEDQNSIWQDDPSKMCPGSLLLSLEAVASILNDLERDARCLLEVRIMTDMKSETRRQRKAQLEAQSGHLQALQEALPPAAREVVREANSDSNLASALFPNVMGMFRRGPAPDAQDGNGQDHRGATGSASRYTRRVGGGGGNDANTRRDGGRNDADTQRVGGTDDANRRASTGSGDPSDPTLVAMAGEHAKHFVPERLPWQVLKGMTRILQLVWAYSGVMAFLKEVEIYQVDFQQHPGHERRLLCSASSNSFEQIEVEWPYGGFFRPQSIYCHSDGRVTMGSPFALYAVQSNASSRSLVELDRSRLPHLTALMCIPERPPDSSQFNKSACVLVTAVQHGLLVWSIGSSHSASNTTLLSLEGLPWRQLTGSIVSCRSVENFLSYEEAASTWCMLLVGWDGKSVPIVVLPLSDSAILPSTSTIRPSLVIPLFSSTSSRKVNKRRDVVAMSFEAQRGHLWTISNHSELDVWDLFNAQSLGRSQLQWPSEVAKFKPRALCESIDDGHLFIVGASEIAGPVLLLMHLRDRYEAGSVGDPSISFLPSQVV